MKVAVLESPCRRDRSNPTKPHSLHQLAGATCNPCGYILYCREPVCPASYRCVLCFDAPKDIIIVPSYHVCEPADKMRKPSCPTCRTAIQQGVPLVEPPPAE
jgi:hypothetical protein